MSETATKLRKEYQPTDAEGKPLGPPQVFEADTPEEMIDKLATAHEHASKKIYELKSQIKPEASEPLPEFTPRALTADEKFKLSQELQNPETFDKAFDAVIEARTGAKPEQLAKLLSSNPKVVRDMEDYFAAEEFKQTHPEYKVCGENLKGIQDYLTSNNVRGTKRNLELAWDHLQQSGLAKLQEEPKATPSEAITSEPVTRPRGSTSTGLFSHHSSASAPRSKPTEAAFAQEVAKMRPDEYRRRIVSDPEFRKRVDALKR